MAFLATITPASSENYGIDVSADINRIKGISCVSCGGIIAESTGSVNARRQATVECLKTFTILT
jgi:hypothetical protein